MSIKTIPIENAEEVEALQRKHRFAGTSFRTNVASNDETIKLWRDQTCEATLSGHTKWVMCLAVLSDGVSLASGSQDKTINIWNKNTVH